MAEIIPFRPADRRSDTAPESDPAEFVEAINDLARQWAAARAWSRPEPRRFTLTVIENQGSPDGKSVAPKHPAPNSPKDVPRDAPKHPLVAEGDRSPEGRSL